MTRFAPCQKVMLTKEVDIVVLNNNNRPGYMYNRLGML